MVSRVTDFSVARHSSAILSANRLERRILEIGLRGKNRSRVRDANPKKRAIEQLHSPSTMPPAPVAHNHELPLQARGN